MKIKFINKFFFIVCLFILPSCKMAVLEKPMSESETELKPSDYADIISAPENLTATHGSFRSVQLTWDSLPNAIQYQIFSAETPFSQFIQIAETTDNSNTITITEKAGTSKYYSVKAVNYYHTISSFSNIIYGTSLAVPVITSIDSTENGTKATVNWWMENCSKNSYQSEIQYIVSCYEEDKTTLVSTQTAIEAETSVTFENLEPHTNYYFEVEAFLSSNQDEIEKSGLIDAETARRLIPKKVEELTVSQGTFDNKITLEWKLPEFTDYTIGTNSYEQHPVYFTIERKLLDAEDSDYEKIVTYLGTILEDDNPDYDTVINFSCDSGTSTSTNLTIDNSNSEDSTELYPDYAPKTTITYTDTTVERGVQYTYKIRSYVDDTKKTISSEQASDTGDGWSLPAISFKAKHSYTSNDNDITQTKVTFSADFESYDIEYTYIISEQYTPFQTTKNPNPKAEAETVILTFQSISEVNEAAKVFDCTESNLREGNYKYTLYISPKTDGSIDNAYASVKASASIIVAKTMDKLPKINNLEIKDGYKNKYVLSWDYLEGYTYKVRYIPIVDKNEQSPVTETIPANKITVKNGKASYSLSASSNDSRKFTLISIPKSGIQEELSLDETYYTLGTAKPIISEYFYDKIVFTWEAVQKAKTSTAGYSISAYYSDDTSKTPITTSANTVIEASGKTYKCTISAPKGYNDAAISGKPITLKLTAKSASQSDSTTATVSICTLGPGIISTKIDTENTDSKKICVKWNEIEGTNKYLIYRTKYDYSDFNTIERTDIYTYEITTPANIIKINGNDDAELINSRVSINYDSATKQFTLEDKYVEDTSNGTDGYQVNQSQISWGIPFGYVVLPVKNFEDFPFKEKSLSLDSGAKVNYSAKTPMTDIKGATYGFGINLKAEKAKDCSKQVLTWSIPFNKDRTPFIYRRKSGTTDSWEACSANITTGSTKATLNLSDDELWTPYDYIVNYNSSNDTIDSASSFVKKQEAMTDSETNNKEPQFKGYLLAVRFEVNPADKSNPSNYQEKIEWDSWDYSERAIGPESATIYLLNKNLSNGWQPIVYMNKKCEKTSTVRLSDVSYDDSSLTQLYIEPTNLSTTKMTNGALKVLRDTRHYYKIEFKSSEGTIGIGDDESVYTYRNITDEEYARCINVIIADALYQCGVDSGTILNGNTGGNRNCGVFKLNHTGGTKTVTWGTGSQNYNHIFVTGLSSAYSDSYTSEFTLNIPDTSKGGSVDSNKLYHLPQATVTVDHPHYGKNNFPVSIGEDGVGQGFLGADLVSESWIGTWGTVSVNNSDQNEFQKYFPYDIATSHKDAIKTVNTGIPIYKSPWWE